MMRQKSFEKNMLASWEEGGVCLVWKRESEKEEFSLSCFLSALMHTKSKNGIERTWILESQNIGLNNVSSWNLVSVFVEEE